MALFPSFFFVLNGKMGKKNLRFLKNRKKNLTLRNCGKRLLRLTDAKDVNKAKRHVLVNKKTTVTKIETYSNFMTHEQQIKLASRGASGDETNVKHGSLHTHMSLVVLKLLTDFQVHHSSCFS